MEYILTLTSEILHTYTAEDGEHSYTSSEEIKFVFTDAESAMCFADTAVKHMKDFGSANIEFHIEEF